MKIAERLANEKLICIYGSSNNVIEQISIATSELAYRSPSNVLKRSIYAPAGKIRKLLLEPVSLLAKTVSACT